MRPYLNQKQDFHLINLLLHSLHKLSHLFTIAVAAVTSVLKTTILKKYI